MPDPDVFEVTIGDERCFVSVDETDPDMPYALVIPISRERYLELLAVRRATHSALSSGAGPSAACGPRWRGGAPRLKRLK